MPVAPHSTLAGFRGLVVDYNMFPFSSNPLAQPTLPAQTTNRSDSGVPDSLESTEVYMRQDWVFDACGSCTCEQ